MSESLNDARRPAGAPQTTSTSSPAHVVADGDDGALSLGQLVALEPRLGVLLADAAAVPVLGRDWRVYENFKRRLTGLVGWHVDHPVLGTTDAYDVAIGALVEELGL